MGPRDVCHPVPQDFCFLEYLKEVVKTPGRHRLGQEGTHSAGVRCVLTFPLHRATLSPPPSPARLGRYDLICPSFLKWSPLLPLQEARRAELEARVSSQDRSRWGRNRGGKQLLGILS